MACCLLDVFLVELIHHLLKTMLRNNYGNNAVRTLTLTLKIFNHFLIKT